HRAGVTPYTSSYEFAECCVFNKQLQGPGYFDSHQLTQQVLHQQERTFSRSYGTILPSSFTQVLSSALVFSTRSPVSVYSTVNCYLCLEGFPGSRASTTSPVRGPASSSRLRVMTSRIYLSDPPTRLNADNQRRASLAFSVTPSQ